MRKIIKVIVFFLITIILLVYSGRLLREKSLSSQGKEKTTLWNEEYAQLEQDTVDALFLGSSHNYCSLNPLLLFHKTGIAGYCLGSPAQDIYATKTYLEFGLATQSPKIILLECRNIIMQGKSEERWNRIAYDNLPFVFYKFENLTKSIRSEEDFISYVFPVFRFHERWKDVTEEDVNYMLHSHMTEEFSTKGYYPRYTMNKVDLTKFYTENEEYEVAERVQKAILEIKEICEKNGAELILWKTPSPMWRESYAKGVQQLADSIDVTYIDLNYYYEEIGLNSSTDFLDSNSHLNDHGAVKVTSFLAEYLIKLNLPNHQGEESYMDYEVSYENYYNESVTRTRDILVYLDKIKTEDYQIWMVLGGGLDEPSWHIRNGFSKMGLQQDFLNLSDKTFLAVIDSGVVQLEMQGSESLTHSIHIDGHDIVLTSAQTSQSLLFDGQEMLSQDQNGMGIVVYDVSQDKVIDSIVFDINNHSIPYRKLE